MERLKIRKYESYSDVIDTCMTDSYNFMKGYMNIIGHGLFLLPALLFISMFIGLQFLVVCCAIAVDSYTYLVKFIRIKTDEYYQKFFLKKKNK